MLPNNDQCLQFYYYQLPTSLGNLNVYVKLDNDKLSTLLPIWMEKNFKQGYWHVVQVPLGHGLSVNPYQIVFEEFVAKDDRSATFGMYIDDVVVRDESCLPPGDCDFEHGFCRESFIPFLQRMTS